MNCIINAARSSVSLLGATLYIFGSRISENKEITINAIPCFICKKMIINAGIEKVISGDRDNNLLVFDVNSWAEDWTKKDMLDDMHQYNGR
jgi:dCMP deaminase